MNESVSWNYFMVKSEHSAHSMFPLFYFTTRPFCLRFSTYPMLIYMGEFTPHIVNVCDWITTNFQSGTPRAYLSEICIDKLTSNEQRVIELKLD